MTQNEIEARLRVIEEMHAQYSERVNQQADQIQKRFDTIDKVLERLSIQNEHFASKEQVDALISRYDAGHEHLKDRVLAIETAQYTLAQASARRVTVMAVLVSLVAILVTITLAVLDHI